MNFSIINKGTKVKACIVIFLMQTKKKKKNFEFSHFLLSFLSYIISKYVKRKYFIFSFPSLFLATSLQSNIVLAKLDISGWVKHRIPGFSKLVGLSTTQHEKLCIALLQRLETVMEAANVLHRKAMGSKKVAKSKNKGRRELQNLICLVNYDRR